MVEEESFLQFLSNQLDVLHKRHETRKKGKQHPLSQQQIAYLTDEKTLLRMAGLSAKLRCVLFHRRYPETKISPTRLLQLYK